MISHLGGFHASIDGIASTLDASVDGLSLIIALRRLTRSEDVTSESLHTSPTEDGDGGLSASLLRSNGAHAGAQGIQDGFRHHTRKVGAVEYAVIDHLNARAPAEGA
jgi:hypothetical protein